MTEQELNAKYDAMDDSQRKDVMHYTQLLTSKHVGGMLLADFLELYYAAILIVENS